MRTRTAIVSFVIGLLSATSLTAAAEIIEGDGAPMGYAWCDSLTEVLPKVVTPVSPDNGTGGFIEGTE